MVMKVQGKLMLCLLIFAIALSNCSDSSHIRLTSDDQVQRDLSVQEDSVVIVNSCENESYRSRLTENTSLDDDTYVLTTENIIDNSTKTHQLDFPSGRAKIMYCTRDYTVVGFACGGPCHSSVFIQHEKNVPIKTFGYCQRVEGRDDIVLYVKEELFEHLVAHNLYTGSEQTIDISSHRALIDNYGQLDEIYCDTKGYLIMKYESSDGEMTTIFRNIAALL